MDDVERALIAGFWSAGDRLLSKGRDPEEVARLVRRVSSKVVSGNLRSWSLVLRAGDRRLGEVWDTGEAELTGTEVRLLCSPVAIAWPGVSLSRAAELFGVNRTTVSRWADPPPEDGVRAGVRVAVDAQRLVSSSASLRDAPDAARRAQYRGVLSARHAAEPTRRGHGGGGAVKQKGRRVTWKQEVDRRIAAAREAAAGERFGAPSSYRVLGRRLVLDYTVNRANRKRDVVRVWTPDAGGVDPGGEVWSSGWGLARRELVERVPDGFGQRLRRVARWLGGGQTGAEAPSARVWQWVCPEVDGGCGRLVYKLYWPMEVLTVGALFSEPELGRCGGRVGDVLMGAWEGGEKGGEPPSAARCGSSEGGFLCLRCCGLVYESSERTSSPGVRGDGGRRKVDGWDRFVKRASGGVLTGRGVDRPAGVEGFD